MVTSGIGKGLKSVGNMVFDKDSDEDDDDGIDKESATAHKKEFISKYGIKCQIPSLYVQQAIYYKRDPKYKIQLVNYVFPKGEDYKVMSHFLNGSKAPTQNNFTDIFKDKVDGFSIRLLKTDMNLTEVNMLKEINLREKTSDGDPINLVDVYFSNDCQYFIMHLKQNFEIRIFEVKDDIHQLMTDIENNNPKHVIKKYTFKKATKCLTQIEEIVFDQNDRFFVCKSNDIIAVVNYSQLGLPGYEPNIFKIDKEKYDGMCCLFFQSESNDKFRIIVANKMNGMKKIHVTNIQNTVLKPEKFSDFQREQLNYGNLVDNRVNYFDDMCSNFQIKILQQQGSLQVVIVNGKENFIIERLGGSDENCLRKSINQIGDKEVFYISDSYETMSTINNKCSDSFYLIASNKFDDQIHIYNSHNMGFHDQIERAVQPNSIRIFDFIYASNGIQILSLNDGEFMLDRININKEDFDNLFMVSKSQVRKSLENKVQESMPDELNQSKLVALNVFKKAINPKRSSYLYSPVRAFSISWPYVTFSGLGNYLLIVNAFTRKTIHRVQIAHEDESIKICETFISSTKDLFLVISKDGNYILLTLNLDNINQFENKRKVDGLGGMGTDEESCEISEDNFKFEQLMSYPSKHVGNKPLQHLFIRGSSRKEVIQLNYKLTAFFLHEGALYTWSESTPEAMPALVIEDPENFYMQSKKLVILDDNNFFFCQQSIDKEDSISEICKVEIKYAGYELTVVQSENSSKYDYINFNVDAANKYLIIVFENKHYDNGKNQLYFKIYDLKEDQVMYESDVVQPSLIGILASGLYTLIDGHIYFNNNVFKIRYDLMKGKQARNLGQSDVFNEYTDILELREAQTVKQDTPINSLINHKFLYVIQNLSKLEPKQLFILPYLHERKIYLNRIKANTNYFYTSIIKNMDEVGYTDRQQAEQQEKDSKKKFDPKVAAVVEGSKFVMKNMQNLSKSMMGAQNEEVKPLNQQSYLIAMNLTEHKYYVYLENGILINRIDYSKWVEDYGEPIATSENGLNFIFKKRNNTEISIIHLDENNLTLIKSFDIMNQVREFVQKQDDALYPIYKNMKSKNHWIQGKRGIDFRLKINNSLDIVVQIYKQIDGARPSLSIRSQQSLKGEVGKCSDTHNAGNKHVVDTIYYYQSWRYVDKKPKVDKASKLKSSKTKFLDELEDQIEEEVQKKGSHKEKLQNVLISEDFSKGTTRWTMNGEYLFFYDEKTIKFAPLSRSLRPENIKSCGFSVSETEKNTKIRFIDCGPRKIKIAIVLDQLQGSTVIIWDITKDMEISAFEVDQNHQLIWDHDGNVIILEAKKQTLTNIECSLKCFTLDHFDDRESTVGSVELGYDQGYRFDALNHNWLILRGNICLSFSYMSFVIKQHLESVDTIDIESEPLLNKAFDVEPYTYIINKNTCFITGDLVKKKYIELNLVLEQFEKIDPDYLEFLHYTKPEHIQNSKDNQLLKLLTNVKDLVLQDDDEDVKISSALHAAKIEGNNRAIDILLTHMSKIPRNCSQYFRNVMPFIVEQQAFHNYLSCLPQKTKQMEEKHILRVKEMDGDIVAMASSRTIYLDDYFYKNSMKEDKIEKQYKSYPVDLQTIKIGWILDAEDDAGKQFLTAIQNSDNIDYFTLPGLQMIIEYLFQKNKKIQLWLLLPLFVVQFGVFVMVIIATELVKIAEEAESSKDGEVFFMAKETSLLLRNVIAGFDLFFTIVMLIIMMIQFQQMGGSFFRRTYTWFDVIFYSLKIAQTSLILKGNQLQKELKDARVNHAVMVMDDGSNMHKIDSINIEVLWILEIQRILSSIAIFFFLTKLTYYMKLVDEIAPFVEIIIRIVVDIYYFLIVVVVSLIFFGASFFLIGQNQVDVDGASPDDIPYYTLNGSFWYMYLVLLGAGEVDSFSSAGEGKEGTQEGILKGLYILSTFMLLIHLLNMLIAMMGESFGEFNSIKAQIKVRDHLSFVMDNWYLNDLSIGKDIKFMKYIVTAFLVKGEDEDNEMLKNVDGKLDVLQDNVQFEQNLIIKKQNEQDTVLLSVLKNQEKMTNLLIRQQSILKKLEEKISSS